VCSVFTGDGGGNSARLQQQHRDGPIHTQKVYSIEEISTEIERDEMKGYRKYPKYTTGPV